VLVAVEEVRKLAEGILLANGVPPDHAATQAGLFIEAEMRAIPSHGLLRLRRVIERIHAGLSVPGGVGKQTWTARSFLSVDGERGLGPVVAMAALDAIIPRAKEDGIAIAAIRNTNHLGALAYYAEHVASLGLT
jgi:LDH2 family malate/lactate/ureidoglycolate dehydrogenase